VTSATLLLAGDSTVAKCPPQEHPMSGWGPYLARHLEDGAVVRNFARGGATTASFRAEGLWDALLQATQPGDWVLIQFGHNDQKVPELQSAGGYRDNLQEFVHDVRLRGAAPVLCTSVERRAFENGRPRPSHGAYPQAVRRLGSQLGVPVIDLSTFTGWLYEHLGPLGSRRLFTHLEPGEHPNWPDGVEDNTHFCTYGAELVATYVARCMRAIRGLDDDRPALGSTLVAS
jgi:lysophospholipase L1-like esterase